MNGAGKKLWGYYPTSGAWVPLQVNANGKVVVDLSAVNLNDLGGVNAPTPADDTFLYWDDAAGKWQSRVLASGDIPNLDAAKITSGCFTMAQLPTTVKFIGIEFVIVPGSVIPTGIAGSLRIPFACTIYDVMMGAPKGSGSIVIDIWKGGYAEFPLTDANSITASTPPTISSAQKSSDVALTDWTRTINIDDFLVFNVDSCTSITNVTISLKAYRT